MISFIRAPSSGFDLGCWTWTYRIFGPFVFYREMLSAEGDPPPLGPWRLAIFLSFAAFDEFGEGLCK